MTGTAGLHGALTRLPAFADLPSGALEPMPRRGVAHDHVRLPGKGLVARVPRWSQLGLDPFANLEQQATAFRRAAPSGHTPELAAVLPPGPDLPMGALVVTEIVGRPPRLPGDMPAIARALAALHALPLPPDGERAPLPAPADPVAATLAQVERQAVWFERAGLAPDALALLEREFDDARAFHCAAPIPITLVGSDVHPGNFLIDAAGKAWFTDLEKAQYGHPAIDLAHASLYTSTKWEREVAAVLAPDEVAAFHEAWEAAVPPALAEAVRPWRQPLRRLTWLRTLSWMARWRVEGAALSPDMPDSLAAHMDAHAVDVLRPEIIGRVAAEWR
ncbi:aminoglycoside phosphotransferase (plasmid) [Azospirillum argentinense]|uniref:Aminoglycoside phosphotransferase n=1 Tax=Azospirillum argentinense TaxID=2970906 RepID=A0A060DNR7_9PROT|nr:phosphotransferase [Azospirillum argentinense]AIB14370.1 aminoglycoside phosphotransferase [Azospirillum argentinense]EZQ05404.1 aminoglycoside phosphotransferase [Azospirillum argentinense]PNQ95281.1 aminoglycoside phosphotransferase [Azospirillum argentinense]